MEKKNGQKTPRTPKAFVFHYNPPFNMNFTSNKEYMDVRNVHANI